MAIIIDGYNVLHCTHTLPSPYAAMNPWQLASYLESSRWKNTRVVLVCDGNPPPNTLDEEDLYTTELVFTGPRSDADSKIERFIEAESGVRELIVVSNDRRIQRAAKKRNANVLASEVFLKMLLHDISRNASGPRHDKPCDVESVDDWLKEFDIDEMDLDSLVDQKSVTDSKPNQRPRKEDTPAEASSDKLNIPKDAASKDKAPEPMEDSTDYWLKKFGYDE